MSIKRNNCAIPEIGHRNDGTFYMVIPENNYEHIVQLMMQDGWFGPGGSFARLHHIFDFSDWYDLNRGLTYLVEKKIINEQDKDFYLAELDKVRPKNIKHEPLFNLNNPNVQMLFNDLRWLSNKRRQDNELVSEGNNFFIDKQWESALGKYENALKRLLPAVGGHAESLLPIYEKIADCYAALGKNDKALSHYQEAVDCDLYNKDVELSNRLVRLYNKMAEVCPQDKKAGYLNDAKIAQQDFENGCKQFNRFSY